MPRDLTAAAEADLAIELAAALDNAEETTLGPTDAHVAAVALLNYAAFLDANTPAADRKAGSPA